MPEPLKPVMITISGEPLLLFDSAGFFLVRGIVNEAQI
jgi:hypothetical protein